jgi:hypothetical protein
VILLSGDRNSGSGYSQLAAIDDAARQTGVLSK